MSLNDLGVMNLALVKGFSELFSPDVKTTILVFILPSNYIFSIYMMNIASYKVCVARQCTSVVQILYSLCPSASGAESQPVPPHGLPWSPHRVHTNQQRLQCHGGGTARVPHH